MKGGGSDQRRSFCSYIYKERWIGFVEATTSVTHPPWKRQHWMAGEGQKLMRSSIPFPPLLIMFWLIVKVAQGMVIWYLFLMRILTLLQVLNWWVLNRLHPTVKIYRVIAMPPWSFSGEIRWIIGKWKELTGRL